MTDHKIEGGDAQIARGIVRDAHDKLARWMAADVPVSVDRERNRAAGLMLIHLMQIARENNGPDAVIELMRLASSTGVMLLDQDGALEEKLGHYLTAAEKRERAANG
ncbi:hypothetical protein [Brytella acorum]|uniref:Uncharacterized protein n=1 Tax=Brytella acorum TaxID=2959299 RepID=A0AA35UX12_9PROT|nr:hypothetical protein [Brytella acorum]MDF3625784.1 hypothetical protein [Brytella acorum]CAI9121213.1 hypothetical protein LMG32879_002059 [Brytella acorum]